jgi:hypothetical protein
VISSGKLLLDPIVIELSEVKISTKRDRLTDLMNNHEIFKKFNPTPKFKAL